MIELYIDVIFKFKMNTFSGDKNMILRLFEFLSELYNSLNSSFPCTMGNDTSKTYYEKISLDLILLFLDTFLKEQVVHSVNLLQSVTKMLLDHLLNILLNGTYQNITLSYHTCH